MIVFWILFLVFALLLALIFTPITLVIRWNQSLQAKLRFCFFQFDLTKKRKKRIKKRKKTKKPSPKKESATNAEKKKRSAGEIFDFLRFLTGVLKSVCKELFSRLRIRVVCLHLCIANEDPARTAMMYGVACPLVYQLCEIISRFSHSHIDYSKVAVRSDFSSRHSHANIDLRISLRIIDVLATGWRVLLALQQTKNTSGGTQHERNPVETSH